MTTPKQAGQALVLALFLLTVAAAALIQAFNAGQLVQEKTRLTNAVDAAAYSGALAQARALNFLAYTNRAMVGHQVAMAHLVTLASWAKFGDTEARQLASSNPPVTLIGGFFGLRHGAGYASAVGLDGWSDAYAPWGKGELARDFAEHDRVVHQVLVRAQETVRASLADARMAAVRHVLAANYDGDGNGLDAQLLSDNSAGFVQRYGGDARVRLRSMVEQAAAKYDFLGPRNDTVSSLLPVDWRCPLLRHELRRRGTTQLAGLGTWRSLDTESYHALRSNQWIGCYYREYPMGYGNVESSATDENNDDIEYVANPPENFADQDFWRWVKQATQWDLVGGMANPLSNSLAISKRTQWQGQGLPSFAELSQAATPSSTATPLRFAVVATRQRERLRTSDAAGVKAGQRLLKVETHLAGDEMAAISAAETFYQRPVARSDGKHELPSLFMPYWQARLSAVTDDERTRARARQGLQ